MPRTPPWRRRGKGWLPEIASFYRTSGHSTSFPILHGPGLRIGADQISQHRQLGIAASAQYQFPQRYEDARVALELRTLALRLDLRAIDTDLVAHNGLGAVIGVGLDTIWLSPQTRDSIAFAAEANRVSLAPLLTGGLIWQIRLNAAVRIELGVGMEVDLVPTHYDIVEPAGTERFVSRWPARPAASLGVEFL